MKEARFDVFKFGVSGMDRDSKMEVRVAQAIRLGAKPPKKDCVPYQEFKAKQRKEKEEEQKRLDIERFSGVKARSNRPMSLKAKNSKDSAGKKKGKSKKSTSGGGSTDAAPGKVGKFDGGMLKLSAKDIAKIKKNK